MTEERIVKGPNESMTPKDISSKRYTAALESLKENDGLVLCLQLHNCQIDDEKASKLFLAMEHSDTITSVDLSYNLITDDGFCSLTQLLRGGSIPSLIFLDVRGNPISSKTHDLLDGIQHVRKILKIYHDSDTSKDGEHLSKLDQEVGTERAVNLYRSKWSAACTDNGDNWFLSKASTCGQSAFTLKDRVQSAIEVVKVEGTLNTSRLAVLLKEISHLASQELSLQLPNDISRQNHIEYPEGVKYLVNNFPTLISILDMEPSQGAAVDCGAGLHRVAIVEVICIILLPCLSFVEEHIISSGVLAKLLKLFSDFPQNSILHCVVVRCLQAILSQSSTILFWSLVKDSCLPSFLAREGTKFAGLHQGRRPSYCGQIFTLSKTLYNLEEIDEGLKGFLNKNEEWKLYVSPDGPFRKMQKEQSGDLCGPKPVLPRLVTNFLQNPSRNLVQVNQFTV